MTFREKLAVGLSVAAIAAGIGYVGAFLERPGGLRSTAQAAEAHGGWFTWRGSNRWRRHASTRWWCDGRNIDATNWLTLATWELDLNETQRRALEALVEDAHRRLESADVLCDPGPAETDDFVAHIRRASGTMAALSAVLEELAGPAEAFYASLDVRQKDRLDEWMASHRRRR